MNGGEPELAAAESKICSGGSRLIGKGPFMG